jgi:phosphoribosylformimino-5-aminoimidazole carboxamide ribotide isomerase
MYLGAGAKRVVMGTTALRHRDVVEEILEVFPERVVVSIDAKNGLVATDGWKTVTSVTAREAIISLSGLALAAVMYTDIAKDGMMAGPNLLSLKLIVDASPPHKPKAKVEAEVERAEFLAGGSFFSL